MILAADEMGIGFQSTLPLRGVTGWFSDYAQKKQYFNPHSPYGE